MTAPGQQTLGVGDATLLELRQTVLSDGRTLWEVVERILGVAPNRLADLEHLARLMQQRRRDGFPVPDGVVRALDRLGWLA